MLSGLHTSITYSLHAFLRCTEVSDSQPRELQVVSLRDEDVLHLDIFVHEINVVTRNDKPQELCAHKRSKGHNVDRTCIMRVSVKVRDIVWSAMVT